MESKGKVKISICKSKGKEEIYISYKIECKDGKTFVKIAVCKVCIQNKNAILSHQEGKYRAKKAKLRFVQWAGQC